MTNHLFIGLGGQGCRTLAELRKVMAQRDGDTQRLKKELHMGFEFLAIDSSVDVKKERKCWTYFGQDLTLKREDWIDLKSVTPQDVDRLAIQADVAPWIGSRQQMSDFVKQNQAIEGANQRRRFGRLLFAHNADSIREAIINQKVSALVNTGRHECVFHIFATIGGGTGSGCLIDVITTIRNQFPDGSLNMYPIFVYLYTTDGDSEGAIVGYFYQNQFATLRDLNTLMCDGNRSGWAPHLLGTRVRGKTYTNKGAILQTVLTTGVNARKVGIQLPTQIRMVAESCFERIFALSAGHMEAAIQQAITGQDIVGNFPWEPLKSPERSYRFSGMGMRRWEVPHRKVHELLAASLLTSAFRQMLFSHWEANKGYTETLASLDNQVSATLLKEMDAILSQHLIASHQVKDLTRNLESEIIELAKSHLREKESHVDLHELDQAARQHYEQHFQQKGIGNYFQVLQRDQAAQIDAAVKQLDEMLTQFWLDPANPLALVHIPKLLDALATTLRGREEDGVNLAASRQRLARMTIARVGEWSKITALSALSGKRTALYLAQAKDQAALLNLDIQERCAKLDAGLIDGVLFRLQQISNEYNAAQASLRKMLDDARKESKDMLEELLKMHGVEGANRYEFDADALKTFLKKMSEHEAHQRDTALALRVLLHNELSKRPLTALASQKAPFFNTLEAALEQTAFERARHIHQDLEQRREADRILEASLLSVLENRFSNDEILLRNEIGQFVDRAVSCLYLQEADSPAVILGENVGVPDRMPRKVILVGLPNDNPAFANMLEAAFRAARSGGEAIRVGTYRHEDPTQLRLLCVDYWLAARFTSVTHNLATNYEGANADTRYFCNLDPSGEEDRRPPLFLPAASEMRDRYEAELWLAQQPAFDIIRDDQHGVSLIDHSRQDAGQVTRLGTNLKTVLDTANHGPMFRLHALLQGALLKQPDGGRTDVTSLIDSRTEQIKHDKGITSPEYLRWMELREHLQTLVL